MAGGNLILNSAPSWQKTGNYKKGIKNKQRKLMYSKKSKKNIEKIVDRRINGKAETKHATKKVEQFSVNDTPSAGGIHQIVPNVSEVFADNGREGNKIQPTSLKIDMQLWHQAPTSLNTENHCYYGVRVMIVQPRQFRGLTQIQANADSWLSVLLKDGGSNIGFDQSKPYSLTLPINSDAIITYYDKVYYEHFPRVNASATTPTSYIYSLEHSRQATKNLKINLKVSKKSFKYDANVNTGLTPDNYNPVLLVGIVNMNGLVQSNSYMILNFTSKLSYKDF